MKAIFFWKLFCVSSVLVDNNFWALIHNNLCISHKANRFLFWKVKGKKYYRIIYVEDMQEVDLIFKPILIFVSNNSHIECITKSLICIIYKLLVQKYVKFVFNKKKIISSITEKCKWYLTNDSKKSDWQNSKKCI